MSDKMRVCDLLGDIKLRTVALEVIFDDLVTRVEFPPEDLQRDRANALCEAFTDVCRAMTNAAEAALDALREMG